MNKSSRWNLYVAAYTLLISLALLFFPHRLPFISFTPNDEVWVRLCGMFLLAFAFYNYFISRERQVSIMLANILSQAGFAAFLIILAVRQRSISLYIIAGIVTFGVIGAALSYWVERRTHVPEEIKKMPRTTRWNLYVTSYTFVYGIATAVFPKQILPLVGFAMPEAAWVRICGLSFLALCYFSIVTYLEKGSPGNAWAIMLMRVWFVVCLIVLGLLGHPKFLLISAGIVGIGVVGTLLTFCSEYRKISQTPSKI